MLRWVDSVLCATAHRLGDGAGRKPVRLAPHQQPENREPRGLTERGQRGERMRGRNFVAARGGTDMTDHRQRTFSHRFPPRDSPTLSVSAKKSSSQMSVFRDISILTMAGADDKLEDF